MPPNGISCAGTPDSSTYISNATWGGIGAAITATSNHPGGVHVAFGDGSVKFVKDSIDVQDLVGPRDPRRPGDHQRRCVLMRRSTQITCRASPRG